MLSILLCGLLVAVNAVPHYYGRRSFPFDSEPFNLDDFFEKQNAGMDEFWRDFDRKMKTFEETMDELSKRLPKVEASEGINGDQYEIKMGLTGFKEDDISVKVKKGMLAIEAHSNVGHNNNNFINMRNLPSYVGASGNWTYENNVLTVVLPITKSPNTHSTGDENTHGEAVNNREPIGEDNGKDVNTGVGANEGANQTNEIPTSNVNLKNDVEMIDMNGRF